MTGLDAGRRHFFHRSPTDMRKGVDGLCGLVVNEMDRDPMSGDVYVFVNRRRTLVKLLYWAETGFGVLYKRLEAGTFQLPEGSELSCEETAKLLSGASGEGRRRGWGSLDGD